MMLLFLGQFFTILLAFSGVALMTTWSEKKGVLDIPNQRSSHVRPTPRGGGLIIVLLTLGGYLLYNLFLPPGSWWPVLGYTAGAILITSVSWLDDLQILKSNTQLVRLGAHLTGATLVILSCGFLDVVTLPILGELKLSWAGPFVTLLWIIALTNIYNFMDGIDGLAGSQAVVAGAGWGLVAASHDLTSLAVIASLLAASSLGFLAHNWSPARIFMGDVGSAFLGYTFATLPILASQAEPDLAVAGALLLWPFLFDGAFTILRRLSRGENILLAHRSHLYQRLVLTGKSHQSVTLLYLGLMLTGMPLALLFDSAIEGARELVFIFLLFGAASVWRFIKKQEQQANLSLD